MNALLELQREFADGLLTRAAHGLTPRIDGAADAAAERLEIYSNNYYVSLIDALADVYPVVARLIGEACFRQVARRYVRRHPSRSGNLHDFGARFAAQLAAAPELAGLPYLPDVARLEWTWHRVFHAPDAVGDLHLSQLADLSESQLGDLRFEFHPATRLLASPYPVLRIWEVNQPGHADTDTVRLDEGGSRVLVMRPRIEVLLATLSAGEFALLRSLRRGLPLIQAYELGERVEPGFDLSAALSRAVGSGVLLRWRAPKP